VHRHTTRGLQSQRRTHRRRTSRSGASAPTHYSWPRNPQMHARVGAGGRLTRLCLHTRWCHAGLQPLHGINVSASWREGAPSASPRQREGAERVHARGRAPKGSTPEGGRRKGPRQREGAERVRARGSVCQKGDSGPLDDMGMKDEEGGTREGRGDGG
jgi:hypothetical protein